MNIYNPPRLLNKKKFVFINDHIDTLYTRRNAKHFIEQYVMYLNCGTTYLHTYWHEINPLPDVPNHAGGGCEAEGIHIETNI
jgi:hypothetical protein